ncbi:hypothetical protein NLG97_g5785 [Lecanicillium saksenae]|uniref:Uncharacterized protein n=1 Tax=Lecanicillium saksenae TaxID=468837 RepID=A0ACC1QT59_9HYPO|nr:hypothetical protein NLG97_g5785 [Lecanicillium saksenae]
MEHPSSEVESLKGSRSRSRSASSHRSGGTSARAEYPKKGKTHIPARLVSTKAIIDLGYPYVAEAFISVDDVQKAAVGAEITVMGLAKLTGVFHLPDTPIHGLLLLDTTAVGAETTALGFAKLKGVFHLPDTPIHLLSDTTAARVNTPAWLANLTGDSHLPDIPIHPLSEVNTATRAKAVTGIAKLTHEFHLHGVSIHLKLHANTGAMSRCATSAGVRTAARVMGTPI